VKAGFAADLAVYSLDEPRYFGFHDLAFAPVLGGGRPRLRRLMCGGRTVVERGEIPGLDLGELGARARRAVAQLRAV
jgi:cytosine/adenosine deaminase-related metal-dependent hydrolase